MRILITGGAGFIGCNLAERLLTRGHEVILYDNLSRPGSTLNLAWLRQVATTQPGSLRETIGDIRDADRIATAARSVDAIFHLAGQVAVTTSVHDPRNDFLINALGTLNVLEAARLSPTTPMVIYASSNKVYGGMEEVAIAEGPSRYRYRDLPHGIPETQPLDFHSPYGCSKGAGDQYVRDYHRIYGLRTVVCRQSCIYGPRQFGVEDQGWVAHFIIAAQMNRPITIYGNGKQVRDILYIADLLDVYELLLEHPAAAGQIYNVGGGPTHTIAIWREFQLLLSQLNGAPIEATHFGDWRPGDQPVFVSDISKAARELDWRPAVSVEDGIARLWHWVREHRTLFEEH